MIIVPFQPEHFEQIDLQTQQLWYRDILDKEKLEQVAQGEAYTVLDGDKVVAIGGVQDIWTGRGAVWAFLSYDMRKYMRFCHSAVLKFLEMTKTYNRIECVVDKDFPNGHRWMKLLGFKREGIMEKYLPNGEDVVSYSRVKYI
jgi:RimJ/RimL family protein N-acetyltransferase